MKRFAMAAALFVALALAAPGFAAVCPSLMAQIDDELQTAQLSESEREEIERLREEGEQQHRQGDHAEAEETLNQALDKLEGAA